MLWSRIHSGLEYFPVNAELQGLPCIGGQSSTTAAIRINPAITPLPDSARSCTTKEIT
jgi:hypothetical protein